MIESWDDPMYETKYAQVRLELLNLSAREIIEKGMPGCAVDLEVMEDAAANSLMLQMNAAVTAAKRVEPEYVAEEYDESPVRFPQRPVRDGALLWLTRHTPERLSEWLASKILWQEVSRRRVVKMQKIHYYGCPHMQVPASGSGLNVHVYWMALKSGKITEEDARDHESLGDAEGPYLPRRDP